jgi:hypothetical protein
MEDAIGDVQPLAPPADLVTDCIVAAGTAADCEYLNISHLYDVGSSIQQALFIN